MTMFCRSIQKIYMPRLKLDYSFIGGYALWFNVKGTPNRKRKWIKAENITDAIIAANRFLIQYHTRVSNDYFL